jgi:hypothetical protein
MTRTQIMIGPDNQQPVYILYNLIINEAVDYLVNGFVCFSLKI